MGKTSFYNFLKCFESQRLLLKNLIFLKVHQSPPTFDLKTISKFDYIFSFSRKQAKSNWLLQYSQFFKINFYGIQTGSSQQQARMLTTRPPPLHSKKTQLKCFQCSNKCSSSVAEFQVQQRYNTIQHFTRSRRSELLCP